jgi:hypothetical protein
MLRETMESLLPTDIMLYLLIFALLFTVIAATLIHPLRQISNFAIPEASGLIPGLKKSSQALRSVLRPEM